MKHAAPTSASTPRPDPHQPLATSTRRTHPRGGTSPSRQMQLFNGLLDAATMSSAVAVMRCGYKPVKELLKPNSTLSNGLSVKSEAADSGICCLTLAAVRGGEINLRERKPVPLTREQAQPYLVRQSDVFVVRGNGNKHLCGQAGLVRDKVIDTIYPDLFIRVPLNESEIDPEFFVTVWNAGPVRAVVEEKAKTTSGIWKVNQGHIESTAVPIPSLEEQRRVVQQLAGLRARLRMIRTAQATSEAECDALLPSLLNRAFAGAL